MRVGIVTAIFANFRFLLFFVGSEGLDHVVELLGHYDAIVPVLQTEHHQKYQSFQFLAVTVIQRINFTDETFILQYDFLVLLHQY